MTCLRISAITLSLLSPSLAGEIKLPPESRISKTTLRSLAELEDVGGEVVGEGGGPGRFHNLSIEILKHGTHADFMALAEDSNPIIRAMGLVCLTRSDAIGTKPILLKRLSEQRSFVCFPWGCVGSEITEGELAWHLLHNRDYLLADPRGWLPPRELLEIDLRVLSNDCCWHFFYQVEPDLGVNQIKVIADIRRCAPSLSDIQVSKAIGRMTPSVLTRGLLVETVKDIKLNRCSRLAAASGLAGDLGEESRHFLMNNEGLLGKLGPNINSNFFTYRQEQRSAIKAAWSEERKRQEEYSRNIDRVDDAASKKQLEQSRLDAYRQAALSDNPIFIDNLIDAFSTTYMDDPAVAKEFAQFLIRASNRLSELAHCWDVDNYMILLAEARVSDYTTIHEHVSKSDLARIKANIGVALKQLKADCATQIETHP
jgi:hypothetical protein